MQEDHEQKWKAYEQKLSDQEKFFIGELNRQKQISTLNDEQLRQIILKLQKAEVVTKHKIEAEIRQTYETKIELLNSEITNLHQENKELTTKLEERLDVKEKAHQEELDKWREQRDAKENAHKAEINEWRKKVSNLGEQLTKIQSLLK